MAVKIETAQAAGLDAVVALWQSAGLTRPWNDTVADFNQALAAPNSTIHLAREGDELVGSMMVGFDGHRG